MTVYDQHVKGMYISEITVGRKLVSKCVLCKIGKHAQSLFRIRNAETLPADCPTRDGIVPETTQECSPNDALTKTGRVFRLDSEVFLLQRARTMRILPSPKGGSEKGDPTIKPH